MITLNGGFGKGTLWGTFPLAELETSGKGYANTASLDKLLPPCDWRFPPPGNLWYPVGDGPYGPCLRRLDIGDIVSTSRDSKAWNPCVHSTIRGNASYRGLSDTLGPYWTKMGSNPLPGYTASVWGSKPVQSAGRYLAVLSGRPCNSADPKVFGYNGVKVTTQLAASGDALRYWNYDTALYANVAPLSLRSTLSALGPLHTAGYWYGKNTANTVIAPGSEYNNASWYKAEWSRPDRTTFVRDSWSEWHSASSYTPKASRGESEIDYLVESNHRITTCVITHVKSDVIPGRFWIKYNQTTKLDWFGWLFPSSFSGTKTVTRKGLETCVLILEPGLTTEPEVDLARANEYCAQAKPLARLLYDSSKATAARTAAVTDVQALQSNWIENLSGLKGTSEIIDPLVDGLKAVDRGDITAARKSLASSYLVYQYAIAPGLSDASDVARNGSQILSLVGKDRFSNERRRGAAHVARVPVCSTFASLDYYTTYHLALSRDCFSQIWIALQRLGLDPSAGQLWDLLPFSFVIDWFGHVGDALRRITQYNALVLNHDILARIESFKVQWPLEEEVIKYLFDNAVCQSGSPLRYSWYDRRVYHDAGHIDPLSVNNGNGLSRSQMVQGAALITQRK